MPSNSYLRFLNRVGRHTMSYRNTLRLRWSSTFYTIKRILLISDDLTIAMLNLTNSPLYLTCQEKERFEEIAKVLECYQNNIFRQRDSFCDNTISERAIQ
jgi:hypothetical protein